MLFKFLHAHVLFNYCFAFFKGCVITAAVVFLNVTVAIFLLFSSMFAGWRISALFDIDGYSYIMVYAAILTDG